MRENRTQFDGEKGKKGRNDEFLCLFLANQRRIFTFILMMVPNRSDAEDLMQETTSWMWSHFDEYTPGTNFGAWGIQIARYKILKLNNQRQNHRLKFSVDVLRLIDDQSEEVYEKTSPRMDALQRCLLNLNDRDRQMLYFRYEQGLTVKKLAQLADRPIQGIYKTMARIHRLLLQCVRRTLALEEIV